MSRLEKNSVEDRGSWCEAVYVPSNPVFEQLQQCIANAVPCSVRREASTGGGAEAFRKQGFNLFSSLHELFSHLVMVLAPRLDSTGSVSHSVTVQELSGDIAI